MVAQLRAPAPTLSWLLPPMMPPQHQMNVYGFRLQTDGSHVLSARGETAGPIGQRIVAAYLLRLATREQLAERYGLCVRQVQEILCGSARAYLIAPVIDRLRQLGIDDQRSRSIRGDRMQRIEEIRAAHARLAAQAVDLIRWPEHYSEDARYTLANDLYLLSGAWLEDRP